MTYEDYIPELEPIIDSVCLKFAGAKTDREDLKQEAHLVLFRCLDKLQAAPGDEYKPLARAIITNRFREIIREEHRRGQWSQCELSDAVLSHDCTDVTDPFDDDYFERERARYHEYYMKNRERILARIHARRAANIERARDREREWRKNRTGYMREWRKNNQEKLREYSRKYYDTHREEIRERNKARRQNMTEEEKERRRERRLEYNRKYREAHKEELREYYRKYRDTHKEEIKARKKERRQNMSEEEKDRRRARARERYRIRKTENTETAPEAVF